MGVPDTRCGTNSAGLEAEVTPLDPGLVLLLLQVRKSGHLQCARLQGPPATSEGSTLKKGQGAAVGGLWARTPAYSPCR